MLGFTNCGFNWKQTAAFKYQVPIVAKTNTQQIDTEYRIDSSSSPFTACHSWHLANRAFWLQVCKSAGRDSPHFRATDGNTRDEPLSDKG